MLRSSHADRNTSCNTFGDWKDLGDYRQHIPVTDFYGLHHKTKKEYANNLCQVQNNFGVCLNYHDNAKSSTAIQVEMEWDGNKFLCKMEVE